IPLLSLLALTSARGQPSFVLVGGALGVMVLIVARQFLTLRDNVTLLARAANFDELTGLANRRQLEEHLRRHLPLTGKDRPGPLLLLGLDDFKAVNDSKGHRMGDEIIAQVARLLREQLPDDQQHVARLSGDEFAIFLKQANGSEASRLAQQLLRTLRERPFVVGSNVMVRLTASGGIAIAPEHGTTPGELLAHADLAMYEAKLAGGDSVRMYDAASETQALGETRLDWKGRIRNALEEDRFVLYAQPILDLCTGEVSEYELLLRMVDETGQLIPPAGFLPIAERFGLIQDIDRWVLRRAAWLMAEDARRGGQASFAVNLSAKAFQTNDLAQMISGLLASAGVEGSHLVLEITETAAISDLERARQFITSLKRLGCRIALDDFGVGFSSFQHLKQLPVDYLKIDGSFVRNLRADATDRHFVKAIVDLAGALSKKTVAEFVEDEATLELLRELGVDYGQGYHIGKPAPAEELLGRDDPGTKPIAA
ncbi:MAG TPA: bifunctional diguanylate cyclase/phosphodiesterase, partial [Candidatus Krumholzibacteria bacterium]